MLTRLQDVMDAQRTIMCQHYQTSQDDIAGRNPMSTTIFEVMALLNAIEDASAKSLFTHSCQMRVSHATVALKMAGSRADVPNQSAVGCPAKGAGLAALRQDKQDAEIGQLCFLDTFWTTLYGRR